MLSSEPLHGIQSAGMMNRAAGARLASVFSKKIGKLHFSS
ncbi:hypothetical protein AGRO_2046 [Agrobacterium sp. ATCC 31749]|nr:hypothetical protein AGRO_2046 [Agrobacterium sp. ATCC 31749]